MDKPGVKINMDLEKSFKTFRNWLIVLFIVFSGLTFYLMDSLINRNVLMDRGHNERIVLASKIDTLKGIILSNTTNSDTVKLVFDSAEIDFLKRKLCK